MEITVDDFKQGLFCKNCMSMFSGNACSNCGHGEHVFLTYRWTYKTVCIKKKLFKIFAYYTYEERSAIQFSQFGSVVGSVYTHREKSLTAQPELFKIAQEKHGVDWVPLVDDGTNYDKVTEDGLDY